MREETIQVRILFREYGIPPYYCQEKKSILPTDLYVINRNIHPTHLFATVKGEGDGSLPVYSSLSVY